VGLILEYYVYYFRYLSYFIWDTIDIVHRYRLGEPISIETMLLHKTWTDKNSNSSRVDQSMHWERSGNIYSFEGDREIQKGFMNIAIDIESINGGVQREFFLPSRTMRR